MSTGIPKRADVVDPLAIVASSYRVAVVEARERGLGRESWFYVREPSNVQGRQPGRYAVRSDGTGLGDHQCAALDYMRGIGWRLIGTP